MPQLGEIVKDLSPAVRPRRETLEGRVVLVQPLQYLVAQVLGQILEALDVEQPQQPLVEH